MRPTYNIPMSIFESSHAVKAIVSGHKMMKLCLRHGVKMNNIYWDRMEQVVKASTDCGITMVADLTSKTGKLSFYRRQ